jgi:hypothetical protein
MNNEPVAYINVEERKLEWAKPTTWHTPTIAQMDKVPLYIIPNTEPIAYINKDDGLVCAKCFNPLYTHPAKTLTDEEMKDLIQEYWGDVHIVDPDGFLHEIAFIKAILRKAQEK